MERTSNLWTVSCLQPFHVLAGSPQTSPDPPTPIPPPNTFIIHEVQFYNISLVWKLATLDTVCKANDFKQQKCHRIIWQFLNFCDWQNHLPSIQTSVEWLVRLSKHSTAFKQTHNFQTHYLGSAHAPNNPWKLHHFFGLLHLSVLSE